ncbi:MAG: hypothetical protein HOD43_07010 [Candidatus Marinimicrobia bacterium]|nr:hypothetical protein [Candidatus Neomarinimicrobiota bacterium]MBT5315356.1 hypothetical protein [Candidatus Neomarinimicrobiota bacterium]
MLLFIVGTKLFKGSNSYPYKEKFQPESLESFMSSIKGLGYKKYPLLSKRYSPNSRIPCTDLIPFIADRIMVGDKISILKVMCAVIDGVHGVDDEDTLQWMYASIEEVFSMPFEKYVTFESPLALAELMAYFIVIEKGGSHRAFAINDGIPGLIAWANVVHQPVWSNNLESLADKANSWVDGLFDKIGSRGYFDVFKIESIPTEKIDSALQAKLVTVSPAARLHLFYTLGRKGGALPEFTNFQIRSLGINVKQTSKELTDSGLVLFASSPDEIKSAITKKRLLKLCESNKVHYRKTWPKDKLVNALADRHPGIIKKIAKSESIGKPNYSAYPGLKDVRDIADKHLLAYKLLCFA